MTEVLIGLVGILIGYILNRWLNKTECVGTLYFYDMGEPNESPAMTSVLNEPVEDIRKHDYVLFKISHK